MSTMTKILLGLAAVVVIAIVVAGVYWFSLPSEMRGMMTWMILPGKSYDNHQEYQTIDRLSTPLQPTALEPTVAETKDDDYNSNVTVITEMVQNENSKMVKKASVQPNGADDYTGWQLIGDEGFEDGVDTFGPSPLSYLTTGVAANLHTQVLRAAEVLEAELDSVKVEVLNTFRWDDMLSAEGAGFLDETHTNIIIESDASDETIQQLIEMALNAWAAGEGLANATVIEPSLVVNGDNWENYRALPGTTLGDEAYVDGLRVSYITDEPKVADYIEQSVEEIERAGFDTDGMTNLEFEILAISESAGDPDRPQLKKITVSFNTPESETWEIYSDELYGSEGTPKAPTSLEYVTAGTALCLTSQLTLVKAQTGLDISEFRVEQQIDYRQESVNSAEMAGYADTVHTKVLVESTESAEALDAYYHKALSLCFAGEGFSGATEMITHGYLNGTQIK